MIESKLDYISKINEIFKNKFNSCADGKVITDAEKLKNQAFNIFDEVNVEMVEEIKKIFDYKRDYHIEYDVLIGPITRSGVREGIIDAIGDVQVFLFGVNHFVGLSKEKYTESKFLASDSVVADFTDLKTQIKNKNTMIERLNLVVFEIDKRTTALIAEIYDGNTIDKLSDAIQSVDTACQIGYELMGTNGDLVIKSIAESNYSKVCPNEDNLARSLKHYRDLGIEVHSIEVEFGDSSKKYAVISSINQTGNDGKYYNKDKFLKSVDFLEPITTIW